MALRGEIVNFGRPYLLHEANEVRRVRHVAVVHQEGRFRIVMRIAVEMIDARGVERR